MFKLLARAYADVHPMMMDRSENRCGGNFLKRGSIINGADWYSFTGGEALPGARGGRGLAGRGRVGGAWRLPSQLFLGAAKMHLGSGPRSGEGRWGDVGGPQSSLLVAEQDLGLPAAGSGSWPLHFGNPSVQFCFTPEGYRGLPGGIRGPQWNSSFGEMLMTFAELDTHVPDTAGDVLPLKPYLSFLPNSP